MEAVQLRVLWPGSVNYWRIDDADIEDVANNTQKHDDSREWNENAANGWQQVRAAGLAVVGRAALAAATWLKSLGP